MTSNEVIESVTTGNNARVTFHVTERFSLFIEKHVLSDRAS